MLTVEGRMTDDINPEIEGTKHDKDLQYLLDRIDTVEFNPTEHDEIVIFSTRDHLHHRRLYPLLATRLCQNNIPCYFLFYNEQIARTFPDLTIGQVQVSNSLREQEEHYLYRSGQIGYPRFDWTVELDNQIITIEGLDDVNLFSVFNSTLQKDYKRYNIEYDDPEVARKVQRGLFTADEVLRYCQLYLRFAIRHEIEIRIVGWESTYIPHGLFNIFCQSDKNQGKKLQYVNIGTEYAHYFGSREDFPYNIGSSNLTQRDTEKKWTGHSEILDDYYNRVRADKSLRESIEEEMLTDLRENILGTVDKSVNLSPEFSKRLKSRIQNVHEHGHHVFCLFSHKFYDVPLNDKGPFSESMCEWIDQTLKIFQEREDLLLLKPHPGESQMPVEKWAPDETLKEYVGARCENHDNIILLKPGTLGSIAVYQQIDCGLVWRSSVGIEMMALGLPMIVSGNAYWLEYLNTNCPNTIKEYTNLIDQAGEMEVDPVDQTRAVVYLHFLKNYIHYFIPHIRNVDYTELDPRKVRWSREHIEMLLDGYAPNIDALLDELYIENFESGQKYEEKMSEPYDNPKSINTDNN